MLKYLIEKEFKQFFRNKFMPKLVVFLPFVMMLIFPWAANMEVKNIKVSIVDNDRSSLSARLISKIDGSSLFKVENIVSSYDESMRDVENGDADIVLEIPAQLESALYREGMANVQISANTVNGTRGGLGSTYLAQTISDFATELREENGSISATTQPQIKALDQMRFNPNQDYKKFMIPAIMVMLITIICGFLPALNIVSEKEVGTIEQINVTPVPKFTFILGKLIPYWVMGFVILSICFFAAWLIYGLVPVGNLLTIYAGTLIYVLCVSGMGLVISNYANTMQQALFINFFFIMICLLISGLFTPLNSMPHWAQVVAAFNPLRYFVQIMRGVYLKGCVIADLLPQFFAIFCFGIFFNVWAILSYKKRG